MQIKHGLISADSHVVTEPDAFLSRMSKAKFGDRIPQIKELEIKGANVERWFVNGRPLKTRGVCNCPAVMGDPLRNKYPAALGGSAGQSVRSGRSPQGSGR